MNRFHTNGLSPLQFSTLRQIGQIVTDRGFFLVGGTALAIYYGHRQSEDLDWFTSQKFDDPMAFAQQLRENGIDFKTSDISHGTLHGIVNSVRASFIEYRYPLLQPLTTWEDGHCQLVGLDDLACMKLSAIAQRGARKDFIDLFVLAKQYRVLPELLALYQKKYNLENIAPVLMGLVYFDDAETEPDPRDWDTPWKEIKQQFSDWVKRLSV